MVDLNDEDKDIDHNYEIIYRLILYSLNINVSWPFIMLIDAFASIISITSSIVLFICDCFLLVILIPHSSNSCVWYALKFEIVF